MGQITTHVLDVTQGLPAAGIEVEIYCLNDDKSTLVGAGITNNDGRLDEAILSGESFKTGQYELHFHVGEYFNKSGALSGEVSFLDIIPIRFGIADTNSNYHIPLLVSPYSYSTYRGS